MEPITLVSMAINMLMPYLVKSGEKIAEEMGGSLWTWLKSKFVGDGIGRDVPTETDKENIQIQLMKLLSADPSFQTDLEKVMKQIQGKYVGSDTSMQINNNNVVEKQVNVSSNSGTINL